MRIVQATADDALVVAALTLQLVLAEGGASEPGYLVRTADHWLRHRDDMPTWIAEDDGSHAGFLQASVLHLAQRPGPGSPDQLRVHSLYVSPGHSGRGIETALSVAAQAWADERGLALVAHTAER